MKVFEQAIIGGISLANRFVRSATWEGLATSKGFCLPELTQLMVSLAEVGVGLIITWSCRSKLRGASRAEAIMYLAG